jgi:hypothetical protein
MYDDVVCVCVCVCVRVCVSTARSNHDNTPKQRTRIVTKHTHRHVAHREVRADSARATAAVCAARSMPLWTGKETITASQQIKQQQTTNHLISKLLCVLCKTTFDDVGASIDDDDVAAADDVPGDSNNGCCCCSCDNAADDDDDAAAAALAADCDDAIGGDGAANAGGGSIVPATSDVADVVRVGANETQKANRFCCDQRSDSGVVSQLQQVITVSQRACC